VTPDTATPLTSSISPIPATDTPASKTVVPASSMEMVLVPAGTFTMGNGNDDVNEQPVHSVNLSAYTIDKYEVTNASYAVCVDAGKCAPPLDTRSATRSTYYGDSQYKNYPVVNVTWEMAKKYCEWRGARLPSEAEWEKAARGAKTQTYPWGNSIDCSKANYKGCSGNDTSEVGKYKDGQSPYGVFDMAGNVWEWTADWYQENYYATLGDNVLDPLGPAAGDSRVIRGGSYFNTQKSVRTTIRNFSDPKINYPYLGFRCAENVTP